MPVNSNDPAEQAHSLCEQIEAELRQLALWSDATPHPDALRSTAPFAYDTLPFESWIQWVFLPRIRQHLAASQPLPGPCETAPMVAISFAEHSLDHSKLERLLEEFDATLNDWRTNHRSA